MKLPKELTTVTPFSKYLAMVLFIILPFLGFFLGIRYQQSQDLLERQLREELIKIPVRKITPSPVKEIAVSNETITFHIQVTSLHNPNQITSLTPEDKDTNIRIPIDSYIYLHFGLCNCTYEVIPQKGILEVPSGIYNLPKNVTGQLRAVGVGETIIVVKNLFSISPSPIQVINTYDEITIENSGSTNMPGYKLIINQDGSGYKTFLRCESQDQVNKADCKNTKNFPKGTFNTQELVTAIDKVGDISLIKPDQPCMKSVSFGSTTTLSYKGKTSGDMQCGNNMAPAYQDLVQIVNQLDSQAK